MALTPIDVQQKTFGTALRGYDLDEVDDFLDEVVTTLAAYEQRLREAQERIAALESEVAERGDAEKAISRALLAAQRSADTIVAEAREEAERILAQARSQADELALQRDRARQEAVEEIDRLREVVADLRERVRALAESVTGELAQMETAAVEALEVVGPGASDAVDVPSGEETGEEPEPAPEISEVWSSPVEVDDPSAEPEETSAEEAAEDAEMEAGEQSEAVEQVEETVSEGVRARRPWERD